MQLTWLPFFIAKKENKSKNSPLLWLTLTIGEVASIARSSRCEPRILEKTVKLIEILFKMTFHEPWWYIHCQHIYIFTMSILTDFYHCKCVSYLYFILSLRYHNTLYSNAKLYTCTLMKLINATQLPHFNPTQTTLPPFLSPSTNWFFCLATATITSLWSPHTTVLFCKVWIVSVHYKETSSLDMTRYKYIFSSLKC